MTMIGQSDDAKMEELLAPLDRIEPVPFAGSEARSRRRLQRPILVAAVLAVVLALAGVAIAAGFGGFGGFSATEHPQAAADVLDAQTLAAVRKACTDVPAGVTFYNPYCHLELDSSRFLTDAGPRGKVWIVADTRGDLCAVGGFGGCYAPLSKSQPITFGSSNEAPTTGGTFFAAGLAMDGVVSVSFTPSPGDGKEVTLPVKDNIWVYQEADSHADLGHCIVAYMADGSSVTPFPEVPCP